MWGFVREITKMSPKRSLNYVGYSSINHQEKLLTKLSLLYSNKGYSDIVIVTHDSDQETKAHKFVLSAFSEYFEDLVNKESIAKNQNPMIGLPPHIDH